MTARVAPWPLQPLGDVVAQVRWILWEFEGAKFGHRVVDDRLDRGGRTLSGLTWRTYSEEFLRLPRGERCPVAQFDALTLDDVVDVIAELFAMRTNIHAIDDAALRFAVLDYAIHAGAHDDAIPALQRALGVSADGQIGRDTLGALTHHPNPRALTAAVLDERYQKAGREVVRHPSQVAYLDGWLSRFGRVLRLAAASAALLVVAGGAISAGALEPIQIQTTPAQAFAPAAVRVCVTVERDADNRELAIALDGPSYFRASAEQLDGLDAARVRCVIYERIPAGRYAIVAIVSTATGKTREASSTLVVRGFGEEP